MMLEHSSLDDPRKLIPRWVLEACAKVHRESDQAEFVGLLMCEPEVGSRLVLALDSRRRLTTSKIQQIEPGPNDSIYIDTANSRYRMQRLSRLGKPR